MQLMSYPRPSGLPIYIYYWSIQSRHAKFQRRFVGSLSLSSHNQIFDLFRKAHISSPANVATEKGNFSVLAPLATCTCSRLYFILSQQTKCSVVAVTDWRSAVVTTDGRSYNIILSQNITLTKTAPNPPKPTLANSTIQLYNLHLYRKI